MHRIVTSLLLRCLNYSGLIRAEEKNQICLATMISTHHSALLNTRLPALCAGTGIKLFIIALIPDRFAGIYFNAAYTLIDCSTAENKDYKMMGKFKFHDLPLLKPMAA